MDEQPDEEIHRVRSGRVPTVAASVPMELGCTALLAQGYVPPTWKLSEPHTSGILLEASSYKHNW